MTGLGLSHLAVLHSCFMEPLVMQLLLPKDKFFWPRINVRVYDSQFGGVHTPMIGYASIELSSHIKTEPKPTIPQEEEETPTARAPSGLLERAQHTTMSVIPAHLLGSLGGAIGGATASFSAAASFSGAGALGLEMGSLLGTRLTGREERETTTKEMDKTVTESKQKLEKLKKLTSIFDHPEFINTKAAEGTEEKRKSVKTLASTKGKDTAKQAEQRKKAKEAKDAAIEEGKTAMRVLKQENWELDEKKLPFHDVEGDVKLTDRLSPSQEAVLEPGMILHELEDQVEKVKTQVDKVKALRTEPNATLELVEKQQKELKEAIHRLSEDELVTRKMHTMQRAWLHARTVFLQGQMETLDKKERLTSGEKRQKQSLNSQWQQLKEKDQKLQEQEARLAESGFETGRGKLDHPLEDDLETPFVKLPESDAASGIPVYAGQG